jgi:cytoskeletal protein CcmA (bactofilin family)
VVQASQRIAVPVGTAFFKLVAPTIELGQVRRTAASSTQEKNARWVRTAPLLSLLNAQAWGKKGWRVKGQCQVPNAHHLVGPLVVLGPLEIGADCVIEGDIKAHGAVKIGPRSLVTGSVFSPRAISLSEGALVHGPVMSEDRIHLSAHCVVGRLTQPATVCARHIDAASGACVHGTLWARESGQLS